MCSHTLVRGLALACLLAAAPHAAASGLQIAPTSLTLASGGPAQAVWLTNTGDSVLRAQVRAFRWSQAEGKDALDPTQALVASPPMLSIPPGGRQLVRVIRTGAEAASGEQTFRLLIDELPISDGKQKGVQYVLRYSVPVFVGVGTAPDLHWSATADGGEIQLDIRNAGTAHAQISTLSLATADGATTPLVPGLLGYVLPDATMHWTVEVPAGATTANAHIKAEINGEPTDQTLSPGAPSR
ncbi:MAG TPA: molecular chaperone [Rhodanobacteraceae bacterium]|nr:molecular chaperone [Rhodanobacteraceae bacterium]